MAKHAAVCFRTRSDGVVTFNAAKTHAPCQRQWDAFNIVQKTTNARELQALKRLRRVGATRTPRLLYGATKPNGRAEVRMTKVGTALTDLGGRRDGGGKALVRTHAKQLRADLRTALTELKAAGVLHQDMCARNVTWDGDHFHVIDFDIVDFATDWSVDAELEEAYDALLRWAAK
jgi:tRNA A-37 threonylcarbamoyl transferase component Bud32